MLVYDEIKILCNSFNARASLRLNRRSFEKTAFKALSNVANTMQNKEYSHIRNCYDRACGEVNNEKIKRWIVDVDEGEVIWVEQILNAIQACAPVGNKVLSKLNTKSGIHIITTPFNVVEFNYNLTQELEQYKMGQIKIEIHKDNPINLYVP